MTADRTRRGLPRPAPDDLTAEARKVYDAIVNGPRAHGRQLFALTDETGRLEGPFTVMVAAPAVGGPLQELGAALRYSTTLTSRAREVAILTVAATRRSEFEWYSHSRVAAGIGLTDGEITALQHGRRPTTLTVDETVVHHVTMALLHERTVSDGLLARTVDVLGTTAVSELTILVGYYDLLDLALRTWEVPLPAGVEPVFDSL